MPEASLSRLYDAVRDVPDFPNPGILFRDITPVLLDPGLFRQAVREMVRLAPDLEIDKIVAVESRGFILAGPVALEIGAGLVPARKVGKLPWQTRRVDYVLEYGTDAIEIHRDAIGPGDRVLVLDDLIATGGTAAAACQVARESGGEVVGVSVLIELATLGGRDKLPRGVPLRTVLTYPRPD